MDRKVEVPSNKPVAHSAVSIPSVDGGTTFYISSHLFAITVPVVLSRALPIAASIERIPLCLGLPKSLDYDGRVGVTFHYSFQFDGRELAPDATLANEMPLTVDAARGRSRTRK